MTLTDWLHHLLQLRPFGWQLDDPYYRFRSVMEVRRAAANGQKIDVNQATVDDWLRLPGLSIHQARLLVTLSQSGVLFHDMEDIAAALSMPVQRLQPLAPILQFCYYERDPGLLFNPNWATAEQLSQIPGVNQTLAEHILNERQQRGAYRNLLDFQQRLQIPQPQLAELMHFLRFNSES
jgi:DNA uptake protein ComE-like DNA-binding protein